MYIRFKFDIVRIKGKYYFKNIKIVEYKKIRKLPSPLKKNKRLK